MPKPPKLSDRRACLIISLTARALAASAKKADIDAYSIDLFQDLDTIHYSHKSATADFGTIGFESRSLFNAIEKLDPRQELPVIYGGGLEHDPNLIRRISKESTSRLQLCGCCRADLSAKTVFCPPVEFRHSVPGNSIRCTWWRWNMAEKIPRQQRRNAY